MNYEPELIFFRKLLKNLRLNTYLLAADQEDIPAFDSGLRGLLYPNTSYSQIFHQYLEHYNPNTVYRISDEYMCNYIFFKLPDQTRDTLILIGPYTQIEHPGNAISSCAEKLSIPSHFFAQMEKYFTDLPLIPDESIIFVLVNTFGERIWGHLDNFALEYTQQNFSGRMESGIFNQPPVQPEDALLSMQALEERYAVENNLLQAVSHGQVYQVEMAISSNKSPGIEERISDPIRKLKNHSIILNTLLRKSAETGAVHPLHIDILSSRFAHKIELIHSSEEGFQLQREMMRKYSLLVKNHSLKGYSLLIRKVITRIDYDLTADLSLKAQAEFLNINASYLSTLFKKETGTTLTDYVNRKRIDHALTLLNTTELQIQTIALHCGIPDLNYFSKTFKKYIGKTPKEYREGILS